MASSNILVAKKRDDSEVTVWLEGVHHRKTDNVLNIYRAAQDYRNSGSKEDLDKLRDLLNPKSSLIQKMFGGQFIRGKDNRVYLQGTKNPLPHTLVRKMEEYEENGWNLKSLVNFWVLCLLNPNPEARDRFFDYCDEYGVTITDNGYAILYKAVAQKKKIVENKDLIRTITEFYLKVKSQKKGPYRFMVYKNTEDNTYRCSEYGQQEEEEIVGNLQELHDNLDDLEEETTVYTDKHTRSMEILIGKPVRMARHLCDNNSSRECSKGLHVGAYKYVSGYGKTGDTILACFVNPMNIVCIPKKDTTKIRCCEYVPRGVMVGGESKEWKELPHGYWEDDYAGQELLQLREGNVDFDINDANKSVVETRMILLESSVEKGDANPVEALQVYEEEREDGEVIMRSDD